MDRIEEAVNYKHSRYNCAQAVLLAYKDKLPFTEEEITTLGSSFGLGMGCMKGTCGALVGANIVLSFNNNTGLPIYAASKKLLEEFNSLCGATICKDLKGIETGKVLCSCDDCVRNAIKILQKLI